MNEWMLSNPGKTVTIYQVAQLARDAYLAAFSMPNVTQGFIKTGIYPLKSKIFYDEFLTSYVSDKPDPVALENVTPENLRSTDDDINLSEFQKRNKCSQEDKNYCIMCNGHYAKSKEEWYKCKICGGWTHESCGHKGVINFFCQKCF